MTIVLIVSAGVAALVILSFFAVNRWSSSSRDTKANGKLRAARQASDSRVKERGVGID